MNNSPKSHKAIVVVHGIGEQKRFETLFEFSDGFHRVTRDIIKGYGEKIKQALLKEAGDNPKKPYLTNAVLRVCEDYRKQKQQLMFASFSNGVNNRLAVVLKTDPQKLQEVQHTFTGKTGTFLKLAQDLEALLTLDYTYKLFPRGLGIERDGFAEVSHVGNALHLYEFWWATEVTNKPGMLRILFWLLKTAWTARRKVHFLLYFPLVLFALVLDFVANILYVIPLLKKYIKAALIDSFGDVNVYITDQQERQTIQDGLQRKIEELSAKEEIEEIWLVGHSLGSVISFDVLRKFIVGNIKTKVSRFYSVGSPLDKVNYFWGGNYGAGVIDLLQNNGIGWFNYYAPLDIVGDYLRGFGEMKNEEFYNSLSPLTAHTTYWQNSQVMENIIRDIYGNDPVFQESVDDKEKRKERDQRILRSRRILIILAILFWAAVAIGIFWVSVLFLKLIFSLTIKLFIHE